MYMHMYVYTHTHTHIYTKKDKLGTTHKRYAKVKFTVLYRIKTHSIYIYSSNS